MSRDVNEGGRGINGGWRQWFGLRRSPKNQQTRTARESGALSPLPAKGS